MSNWFARQSAAADAANTWNSLPGGGGTWLTWPPAAGDVLLCNNRTITPPASGVITVAEIRNDTTGGATAGGYVNCTSNCTITANLHSADAGVYIVETQQPAVVTIVGNVYLHAGGYGVEHNATTTLTITGALDNSDSNSLTSRAVKNGSTGTVEHVGAIVPGYGSSLKNDAGGTINTTGTLAIGGTVGGGESYALYNVSTGTINAYRDVKAGAGDHGARKASSGPINVYGYLVGGDYNGSGTRTYAGYNQHWSNFGFSGLKSGAYGLSPVNDGKFVKLSGDPNAAHWIDSGGVLRQLLNPALDAPAPADVRDGVTYNYGALVGTLELPPAGAVSLGVGYGAGGTELTGTALLDPTDVWDVQASALIAAGSIGERLKNCGTASSTAATIAAALDAQT